MFYRLVLSFPPVPSTVGVLWVATLHIHLTHTFFYSLWKSRFLSFLWCSFHLQHSQTKNKIKGPIFMLYALVLSIINPLLEMLPLRSLWLQLPTAQKHLRQRHLVSTTRLLAIAVILLAVPVVLIALLPLPRSQHFPLLVSIFCDLELKERRRLPWSTEPISGDGGWANAAAKAKAFVSQLTIDEKVNLTTGVDTVGRCVFPSLLSILLFTYLPTSYRCVGNTGSVPRLGFEGFCLQDSPVGVRNTDYNSVFPSGLNAGMTWDRNLMKKRGEAMGAEFRGKGVNVALVLTPIPSQFSLLMDMDTVSGLWWILLGTQLQVGTGKAQAQTHSTLVSIPQLT